MLDQGYTVFSGYNQNNFGKNFDGYKRFWFKRESGSGRIKLWEDQQFFLVVFNDGLGEL